MENEIKVGEYIRDQYEVAGKGIGKVIEVTPNYARKDDGFKVWFAPKEKKIKHDFDLWNLIEPYDYVNGHRVIYVDENEIQLDTGIFNKDILRIETIATHEQFESISYKVERKD